MFYCLPRNTVVVISHASHREQNSQRDFFANGDRDGCSMMLGLDVLVAGGFYLGVVAAVLKQEATITAQLCRTSKITDNSLKWFREREEIPLPCWL